MKAVDITENSSVIVKEVNEPIIGKGDVLIKLDGCGICGTDKENLNGDSSKPSTKLGHEICGTVLKKGQKVNTEILEGMRVFVHHHTHCNECHYCLHGNHTMCEKYQDSLDPCGMSEKFVLPEWNVLKDCLIPLPDSISNEEGVLVEPLACCIRGWGKIKTKKNIALFEEHSAVDLITSTKIKLKKNINKCLGAYVLNNKTNKVITFAAKKVILASGGVSKAYLYTTNPPVSTGDGIAMAWRAGCKVKNMEFIQFHPTCLYHPMEKSFLISETLRGEGGILKLPNGQKFMHKYHERADLAPRDIVARAIDSEMKQHGLEHVYLDISMKDSEFIKDRFPNIYRHCKELNIDITKESIPVVPAAHYTCGGVATDLNALTSLGGLYAIGEAACTGLHGANRLASNSLLECLVFSSNAVSHIEKGLINITHTKLPSWDESKVCNPEESVMILQVWNEMRRFMWNYVGIVRSNQRLQRASLRIEILKNEVQHFIKIFI